MALNGIKKRVNPVAGLASIDEMSRADILEHKDVAVREITPVPRNQIAFHENNDYRQLDSEETIRLLANGIKSQGLLDNLVVMKRKSHDPEQQDKSYVLLSGERRLRAIQLLAAEDPEMAQKFATIPCRVIPESAFSEDPEIRRMQEELLIDEPNLQRRGGVGDERMQRKATARYAHNLQVLKGISQEEADRLTISMSGMSSKMTTTNLKIEREMIVDLRNLLDYGIIPKRLAMILCSLPVNEQELVANALMTLTDAQKPAQNSPTNEINEVIHRIQNAVNIRNDIERMAEYERIEEYAREKVKEIYVPAVPAAAPQEDETFEKKAQKTVDNHIKRTTGNQREKYINRCDKLKMTIERFAKDTTLEKILLYDAAAGNGPKIADSIEEVYQALTELREKLKAAKEESERQG